MQKFQQADYKFFEAIPNQSTRARTELNGERTIVFNNPPDRVIDHDNIQIMFDAIALKSNTAGDTDAAWNLGTPTVVATNIIAAKDPNQVDSISSNPVGCVFTSVSYQINEEAAITSSNYAQSSTVYDLVFQTKEENERSFSPYYPSEYVPFLASYSTAANFSNGHVVPLNTGNNGAVEFHELNDRKYKDKLRISKLAGLDNVLHTVAAGTVVSMRMGRNLQSVFKVLSDTPIIGGKHTFKFIFDSTYLQKLLLFRAVGIGNVKNGDTGFRIENFKMLIPTYKHLEKLPINMNLKVDFMTPFGTKAVFVADNTYQLELPRYGAKYVAITFKENTVGFHINENSYEGPFSLANKLSGLYITIGGVIYPAIQYNFIDGVDYMRAYNDYITVCGAQDSGTNPVLTYSQWKQNPVFLFAVGTEAGLSSRNLQINTVGGASLSNTYSIHTTVFFHSVLNIKYNSVGVLEEAKQEEFI